MSATIETIITCDAGFPGCDGTFQDGDCRNETARQQRNQFKAEGWHYQKGKDYCGVCWEKMKRGFRIAKG